MKESETILFYPVAETVLIKDYCPAMLQFRAHNSRK